MRNPLVVGASMVAAVFLGATLAVPGAPLDVARGDPAASSAADALPQAPGEVIARLRHTTSRTTVNQIAGQCKLRIVETLNDLLDAAATSPSRTGSLPVATERLLRNTFRLKTLTSQQSVPVAISCLKRRREVLWAEPNFIRSVAGHRSDRYPNDPAFIDAGRQWGLLNAGQTAPDGTRGTIDADIDVVQAWDLPHNDCSKVIVAVFDTGADLLHGDLAANLWVNPGETAGDGLDNEGNGLIDDVHGFDFTQAALVFVAQPPPLPPLPKWVDVGGDGPQDTLPAGHRDGGHGTAVAGIIGAEGNNGRDMAGICWKARLMILRLGALVPGAPRAGFEDWNFLRAATYVVIQKKVFGQDVRVINYSVGGPATSDEEKTAVKAMEQNDLLLVTSAGNDGDDVDATGPGVPGAFPCSLPSPHLLCVAASTKRDRLAAFSNTGKDSVDLAAPGAHVVTLQRGVDGGGVTPDPGLNGTSFAAPHVAGIAALAFSLFPGKTALDVRRDILSGAPGPPAASGTDQVEPPLVPPKFSIPRRVASGGRLRWPYTGDLGDAPIGYGTIAAPDGGALHWDIGNEFFGIDATPEVDANTPPPLDQDPSANLAPVDRDLSDEPLGPGNGQFAFFPPPPWPAGALVKVIYRLCSDHFAIRDVDKGRYRGADPDRTLYVNGWFDLNHNGVFDPAELLLEDVISPPPPPVPQAKPAYPNVTINLLPVLPPPVLPPVFPPPTTCQIIVSKFTVPPPGGTPDWIRFRLDYGEDIGINDPRPLFRRDRTRPVNGPVGWARHGEVEDFRPPEVDRFPTSQGTFTLHTPFGQQVVTLSGPTTVYVGIGPHGEAADLDRDGLDEVQTEIVELQLTGTSPLGAVQVRLRQDQGTGGSPRSFGGIEELDNAQAGRLDLPPFAPAGLADSFFDIFFEVEVAGMKLHNVEPKRMKGRITNKPPSPGDTYESFDLTDLFDEQGRPTAFAIGLATHVPVPREEPLPPPR